MEEAAMNERGDEEDDDNGEDEWVDPCDGMSQDSRGPRRT